MNARTRLGLVILFSLITASILALVPLQSKLNYFRPDFLGAIVIYWGVTYPNRFGVGKAWIFGLLQDIVTGSLLGQQALSIALITYFANQLRHRMQLYTGIQQAFVVLLLVGMGQLLRALIQILIGHPPQNAWYWVTTLSTMLFWPILARMLQSIIRIWVLRQGPISLSTA
jgi:rod shape-determining protein MreD